MLIITAVWLEGGDSAVQACCSIYLDSQPAPRPLLKRPGALRAPDGRALCCEEPALPL
jgi:hypothetical protein